MKKQTKVILCSVAIVAVLNMVLPKLLAPFATAEEKAPPAGAKNLSFKGQLLIFDFTSRHSKKSKT